MEKILSREELTGKSIKKGVWKNFPANFTTVCVVFHSRFTFPGLLTRKKGNYKIFENKKKRKRRKIPNELDKHKTIFWIKCNDAKMHSFLLGLMENLHFAVRSFFLFFCFIAYSYFITYKRNFLQCDFLRFVYVNFFPCHRTIWCTNLKLK